MKSVLSKCFFVFVSFCAFLSIWTFLIPERKTNGHAESKMRDSAETETFKKDILAEHNSLINSRISATLHEIHIANHVNSLLITEAVKDHGPYSDEVKKLMETKYVQDKMNLEKVKEIIDKYGWPGVERIGAQNNYTLFAAIQNSDFETQEKYMPVMEQAVRSGSLAPEYYASLVDRKALVQHQQQIYGTQVNCNRSTGEFFFAPIIKEESVNERRSEIGLPPIEEYAKTYNIEYGFCRKTNI